MGDVWDDVLRVLKARLAEAGADEELREPVLADIRVYRQMLLEENARRALENECDEALRDTGKSLFPELDTPKQPFPQSFVDDLRRDLEPSEKPAPKKIKLDKAPDSYEKEKEKEKENEDDLGLNPDFTCAPYRPTAPTVGIQATYNRFAGGLKQADPLSPATAHNSLRKPQV